jgi:putative glutamine amidotransferase
MNVAVTMRSVVDDATGERRDCISRDIVALVERMGAVPMLVPNGLHDAAAFVGRVGVDGLLLTGGNDLCGVDASENAGAHRSSEERRDRTEEALVRFAVETQVPVFGICRGLQLIARWFGGGIERIDSPDAHRRSHHALKPVHAELEALVGAQEAARLTVQPLVTNSFHRFGVRAEAMPTALAALAMSPDGYVEALRHRELPIVAVCWHPERAGSATALDALLLGAWMDWCMAAAART